MNQARATRRQIPPMIYDTVAGSDRPSGAMHIYVEHTTVINRAGNRAI